MTPPGGRYRISPAEVAAQRCIGEDSDVPPLHSAEAMTSPVGALEDVLRPALRKSPCLVSFSGGRDSSALLAVAARLARREGLATPIPVTLRVSGAPRSEESDWQERVVEYLALDEWVRIDLADELDYIGPCARQILAAHGLLWPPNLHFFVPLIAAASGGALVSGVGGDAVLASGLDDLMGQPRWRTAPRRLVRRGYRTLPSEARRPYVERRLRREAPWLRRAALEALVPALLDAPSEPRALDARLGHVRRLRSMVLTLHGLNLISGDQRTAFVNPYLDLGFLSSLARFLGPRGVGGRTAVMRALFGDLLPEAVLARPTKATFGEAFCGPYTRELVATWNGEGLDPKLVDPAELRGFWGDGTQIRRLLMTAILIQAVWLSTQAPDASTSPCSVTSSSE